MRTFVQTIFARHCLGQPFQRSSSAEQATTIQCVRHVACRRVYRTNFDGNIDWQSAVEHRRTSYFVCRHAVNVVWHQWTAAIWAGALTLYTSHTFYFFRNYDCIYVKRQSMSRPTLIHGGVKTKLVFQSCAALHWNTYLHHHRRSQANSGFLWSVICTRTRNAIVWSQKRPKNFCFSRRICHLSITNTIFAIFLMILVQNVLLKMIHNHQAMIHIRMWVIRNESDYQGIWVCNMNFKNS